MSTVDSHRVDDGIYRTTFDPSTESVCVALVEALEAATGSGSPDSMLADSIDVDALQQLYRDESPDSWMLTFDHDGIEITLWGGGRIHVEPAGSPGSAASGSVSQSTTAPTGPTGPTL